MKIDRRTFFLTVLMLFLSPWKLLWPDAYKTAVDSINAWTRAKMREDSMFRKIMPLVEVPRESDTAEFNQLVREMLDRRTRDPAHWRNSKLHEMLRS